MRHLQLIGLLLWRGGILLAIAAGLFEVGRVVLRFVDLPAQLEIGFGLAIAGFVLVMTSLIVERVQDSRSEGGKGEK